MITFKLSLLLGEGLIFGLVALGIYVAFQWYRFPDLTPDGSFVLGAIGYVIAVINGIPAFLAIPISIILGTLAGVATALINRFFQVPAIVAGLLMSSALYSLNWLLLGKPNQFLRPELTLIGNVPGESGAWYLLILISIACLIVVITLSILSHSTLGIRIRGIGENSLLARDIGKSETLYTVISLAVANGIIGLAGALFAQRSFSADINMGVGITIVGLAGMILGLVLVSKRQNQLLLLGSVLLGAILYKAVIIIALELGFPAESFKLITAAFLLLLFFAMRSSALNFLKGLKWN